MMPYTDQQRVITAAEKFANAIESIARSLSIIAEQKMIENQIQRDK